MGSICSRLQMLPIFYFINLVNQHRWRYDIVYKKDSFTSRFLTSNLVDTLKNAIKGHWDKIILDKSRASVHAGVVTEGNACGAIRSSFKRCKSVYVTKGERIATSLGFLTMTVVEGTRMLKLMTLPLRGDHTILAFMKN